MITYSKVMDTEEYKKLIALATKCRVSEDIINNTIAGNVRVQNMEAYDRIYKDLITDTIAFDAAMEKIRAELIGEDVYINGLLLHVISARTKLFATVEDDASDEERATIGKFLISRGFVANEIV